jgi:hypothetical protein
MQARPSFVSQAHKPGACEFRGSPPGGDAAKLGANAAGAPHLQSELPVVAPGLILEPRRPRRGDKETRLNGRLPGTHMRPHKLLVTELLRIDGTAGGSADAGRAGERLAASSLEL